MKGPFSAVAINPSCSVDKKYHCQLVLPISKIAAKEKFTSGSCCDRVNIAKSEPNFARIFDVRFLIRNVITVAICHLPKWLVQRLVN